MKDIQNNIVVLLCDYGAYDYDIILLFRLPPYNTCGSGQSGPFLYFMPPLPLILFFIPHCVGMALERRRLLLVNSLSCLVFIIVIVIISTLLDTPGGIVR